MKNYLKNYLKNPWAFDSFTSIVMFIFLLVFFVLYLVFHLVELKIAFSTFYGGFVVSLVNGSYYRECFKKGEYLVSPESSGDK